MKMNKRIVRLEATCKLYENSAAGLREAIKQAANKRAFKPIVPGHEERHGVWIGPEEVEAHRQRQVEETVARDEAEHEKNLRKEMAAAKRAEREAEKAQKQSLKAERKKWKADFIAARPARELAARALTELDPNQAGPSNLSRQYLAYQART